MKQGRYSLQKTGWKELDLCHPRWNSRNLQSAEERYLRLCDVSAMTAQLPCWIKICCHPLDRILGIIVSRMVLEIVYVIVYHVVVAEQSSSS
jgi:hypothetical protein